MQKSIGCPKLIIVCGLPGSGKTTHATALEQELGAVQINPDEWMQALSLSLHDEEKRAHIEALQWTQTQRLLALGQTVIIEWGNVGQGGARHAAAGSKSIRGGCRTALLVCAGKCIVRAGSAARHGSPATHKRRPDAKR